MVLGPNNAFEWFQEMGFKTTFKAGYVKRIRPVCLLLSNQTRNQEPTICRPARIGNANKNQSTPQAQKSETPILRWKNGPFFWVPYWKRNSVTIENGPPNGARFLDKTGSALWCNGEGFCCSVFAPDARLV